MTILSELFCRVNSSTCFVAYGLVASWNTTRLCMGSHLLHPDVSCNEFEERTSSRIPSRDSYTARAPANTKDKLTARPKSAQHVR